MPDIIMQTVTKLDEHRKQRRQHPDGARLRAVGQRFQEMVPGLLDAFFSQSDDFLFNLAEKGGVDSAQYFDVLRVLRRRKADLRLNILAEVEAWLTSGAQSLGKDAPQEEDSAPHDYSKLTLMDDEELERRLAVDSFASRTYERSGDDWLAFCERMQVLTCQKHSRNSDVPYNPEALGKIVLNDLETIDAPFNTTLMLFRLFDDLAIQHLIGFYSTSNTWLIEEGILPNLKLIQARQPAQVPVNDKTISQIQATLASASFSQGSILPNINLAGPTVAGASQFAGSTGVMLDAGLLQQMMMSMSQIQTQPLPVAQDLVGLKTWTAQQAQQVVAQAEGTLEAGTVSLVAMLFEYILDDESLSVHMKQLLARMQIPIIKVALLDKDFFTDTEHNARLLLNRMARAASGWHPDAEIDDDFLLTGMEKIVSQLNHEFEDDLTIFETLLTEFETLVDRYQTQKNHQIESIREAEEEAFEHYKQQDRSQLFMDTLLANEQLPADIEALLVKPWCSLMKHIFSHQGESKAWKTSARIARELVWSLQPGVQMTQMARFNHVVPKLLDGFASGLKGAGLSEAQIASAIAAVKAHHVQHQAPLNEEVWDAQEKLEQFDDQVEKAEELLEAPAPLQVDEPVVQIRSADLTYYLDQVEALSTDQWFDIEMSDGRIKRGCLSLIIGEGSKYVFTDHNGDKIAERSAIGLAMAMRNEQFVPLSEDPLMDRMINNLVDNFEQPINPQ